MVRHLEQTYGHLDILINNAGVFMDGNWGVNTVDTVELDTVRRTFETNLLGVIAVTRAVLPLLEKSPAGRIVNVSSIMGSLTLHAQSDGFLADNKPFAYDASKAALNLYTIHLAARAPRPRWTNRRILPRWPDLAVARRRGGAGQTLPS